MKLKLTLTDEDGVVLEMATLEPGPRDKDVIGPG
jgi:hypothetical protein